MNAKVIYIAGVPTSGKTSIVRAIMKRVAPTLTPIEGWGLLRGMEQGQYKFLGTYGGVTPFEGTDGLSMTVIDEAIEYCNTRPERCVIFAEGDRLFNERFLRETHATLILIDATPGELDRRQRARGDKQTHGEQTPLFLKRCRTKVENFAKKHGTRRVMNNTLEDAEKIVNALIKLAERWLS